MLLSMHEDELALQKAVNSEDTDLIYLTLFHLERSRTDLESFYKTVYTHPEAVALLKLFFKHSKVTPTDRTVLHNFLVYGRNYLEAGFLALRMAQQHVGAPDVQIRVMKEAAHLFSQTKDLAAYKSIVDEQIDLLDTQRALDAKLVHARGVPRASSSSSSSSSSSAAAASTAASPDFHSFLNLSLVETLDHLIALTVDEAADAAVWENEIGKLVKRFKVAEKLMWHVRVQVYCRRGSWLHLGKLAAEKKSPIGYKPFAVGCIR